MSVPIIPSPKKVRGRVTTIFEKRYVFSFAGLAANTAGMQSILPFNGRRIHGRLIMVS